MTNLRSVAALLAISAALSCATAINQEGGLDPSGAAGADSSGAGLGEEGGTPAGGSAEAGSPNGAGKGGTGSAGKGGSGSGGKSGSGGTVGAAGASMGGKAGTSSSGAGGSSAGSTGTAGGTSTGPCDNPVDLPAAAMNTGDIGTAAACFRTKAAFNTLVCSNMADRTVKVNGMAATCGVKTTFPPAIDSWNYFDITAGAMSYAQLGWFSG